MDVMLESIHGDTIDYHHGPEMSEDLVTMGQVRPKSDDLLTPSSPTQGIVEEKKKAHLSMGDQNGNPASTPFYKEENGGARQWSDDQPVNLSLTHCDKEDKGKANPRTDEPDANSAALNLCRKKQQAVGRPSVVCVNPAAATQRTDTADSDKLFPQMNCQDWFSASRCNFLDSSEREQSFKDAMSILHGPQTTSSDCKTEVTEEAEYSDDIFNDYQDDFWETAYQNYDSLRCDDSSVMEVVEKSSEEVSIFEQEPPNTVSNDPVLPSPFEPEQHTRTSESFRSNLSEEQLLEVWELAKKLYKARVAYNQSVCRPLPAPEKQKGRERRKGNGWRWRKGRVCHIGKGFNWEDPPEWQWGDPIPEEIRAVLPNKRSETEPPAVICLSDDDLPPGPCSSTKESTSSSVKKQFSDHSITISDSEDELPDVSAVLRGPGATVKPAELPDVSAALRGPGATVKPDELPDVSAALRGPGATVKPAELPDVSAALRGPGATVKSAEPPVSIPFIKAAASERLLSPEVGSSITVCSVLQVDTLPISKDRTRKRLLSAFTKKDVITLESSDDSDSEVELVQIARKRQKERRREELHQELKEKEQQKLPVASESAGQPSADSEPKTSWSCPICLEPKEQVETVMSTTCGHVFCGPCITSTIKINKQCPTCRRKLTARQIHRLFI